MTHKLPLCFVFIYVIVLRLLEIRIKGKIVLPSKVAFDRFSLIYEKSHLLFII